MKLVQVSMSTRNTLARAMDSSSTIGSCRSTSGDCKAQFVKFPCKMRYIRISGFSFSRDLHYELDMTNRRFKFDTNKFVFSRSVVDN